jgi:mono/diheme cytochrome c family protein
MKGINKKNILAITFIFSSLLLLASTQFPPWDVPAEVNENRCPIPVDKKAVEAGKALFNMQCMACHGATGKGDGAIPSGNFTTKAFLDQSDGAIFYKITTGRGTMPSFKALKDNDVWHLIIYIRSLTTHQEELVKKNANVVLEFDDTDKVVTAKVYEVLENGEQTPATEIKVNIYVKRYFADMPIGGSSNYTNSDGSVSVTVPEGIPGDGSNLQVVAKVEDSDYNPVEVTQEVAWGIEKAAYWNDERQLWKNNDFVPYWVLFSYFGITLGILAAIGYALMLVMKIRKLGAK